MPPQKTAPEGDAPAPRRQVNNILQNLRGEHFRHTRNILGRPASSGSLSSHAHNQPTLPINLIYPSPAPATTSSPSWAPGPSPPRSWRSSAAPNRCLEVESNKDVSTAAWRERALSLLFSSCTTNPSPASEGDCSLPVYPNPTPIPPLTLLCLQVIRATFPGTDFVQVIPFIPLHLRRVLLRYTAVHAPLSQTELDALCQGSTYIDTELIVVGPRNTLHGRPLQKKDQTTDVHREDHSELGHRDNELDESWDDMPTQDSESLVLRSLAILSSSLSAATVMAFPPTITHLALIRIPHRISLQRLPTICPLLVFLDLSYNTWLYSFQASGSRTPMLEEVEWGKLRRLEVVGLRECLVTPKVLLELNRGRWEDIKVIQ